MKCKDLEELLSSYADGELAGVQRDFIQEHLNGCVDCRTMLDDYRKARERLLSLRVIPPIPDIKEAIMLRIKMADIPIKLRQWLRPTLVATPVLIAVIIILSLYLTGTFSGIPNTLTKAYAAMEKLESYRYIKDEYTQLNETDEPAHSYHAEIEYSAPDYYHLVSESNLRDTTTLATRQETIRIGDQVYVNIPTPLFKFEAEWYEQFTPTKDRTLEFLNLLTEIETMPEEVIDRTDCYHYVGVVDMDKFLAWSRPTFEKMYNRLLKKFPGTKKDLDGFIEGLNSSFRTQEITCEFWIGKNNYLIRQGKLTYQTLPGEYSSWNLYKSISILEYDKFNEPILIQPPLDESGELLDGWLVYTLEE